MAIRVFIATTLASPVRLVDTRPTGGPIQSGDFRCFSIAGVMGTLRDAGAIILNGTAVGQTTNGWQTAYPSGQLVPATATLNSWYSA